MSDLEASVQAQRAIEAEAECRRLREELAGLRQRDLILSEHGPHADWCEAERDHVGSCATATELGRLRAFAEAVRDEWECYRDSDELPLPDDHVDDCWHCDALQALGQAR